MQDTLLAIFAEEATEIIEVLQRGVPVLTDNCDPEATEALFRAAHTMKGNAGIVGFDGVADLARTMEAILEGVRKGRLKPDAELVSLMLNAVDALKVLTDGFLAGGQPEPPAGLMAALAASVEAKGP
ncbi:MAG: Hpt domain-containing protein [Pseudomonadota bacterium]